MHPHQKSLSDVEHDKNFVRNLYLGVLGREPDDQGLMMFVTRLNQGCITRVDLIKEFLTCPEYAAHRFALNGRPEEPSGCLRAEAEEVFKKFVRYTGDGRPGYITSFLGGLSDIAVSDLLTSHSGVVEDYPIPGNFHGETLEWLATLRSILDAKAEFNMVELGAGWGPWCVVGYLGAKQKAVPKIRVVGVEADQGHVEFMRQNFYINGLPEKYATVVHGAVGVSDGVARFPRARNAQHVYGGAAAYSDSDHLVGPFAAFMERHSAAVQVVEEVPCYSLSSLLGAFNVVDLLHCDIQGGEMTLFPSTIDLITSCVRRVVIGTHSFEIDRRLTEIFASHGWTCEGLSVCVMQNTPGGPRLAGDGMQVWRNRSL